MLVLFGAGNYNTLGALHEAHRARIPVFLLCVGDGRDVEQGNIILYSRCVDKYHCVASELEGLKWLLENADRFPTGSVILPTSDVVEQLLDSHAAELNGRFRFPSACESGQVSRLMDKRLQTELASRAGVRVIESQYSNAPDFDFGKVIYPCMAKPLNSTAGSKGDMRVCDSEEELREALASGKHTSEFIVQQYIRNEADLLFLGVAYGSEHDPWIPAVVVKPGVSATGEYSHAMVSTDVDAYMERRAEVCAFIRGLDYRGPFSIEFCLEKGRNYFLEINLRNDGTSHYPLGAGVNLAEAYYNFATRGVVQKDMPEAMEYEMIDETSDLRRVLNHELGLGEWIGRFRRAGTYRYYAAGDRGLIWPLTRMFAARFLGKIRRMIGG